MTDRGKYIAAWILVALVGNVLSFLGASFALAFSGSLESAFEISAFSTLIVFMGISWIVYAKLFPSLEIKKVMGWYYVLGTFGVLSSMGRIGMSIKDAGGDPVFGMYMNLISWGLYLLLFRHYFKNIVDRWETTKPSTETSAD